LVHGGGHQRSDPRDTINSRLGHVPESAMFGIFRKGKPPPSDHKIGKKKGAEGPEKKAATRMSSQCLMGGVGRLNRQIEFENYLRIQKRRKKEG